MNTEEKAKAYDKIIEKATKMHNENCDACKACIEELIPELAESEDEKIRRDIIELIKETHVTERYYDLNKMLTWLEKQGEPIDINPSEFDLRLNKLLKQFETLPKEELASSLSFYLNVVQNDGSYKADEKQGKPNPYSGVSFKYNGHTWGMCARDNGVEILFDGELKAFLSSEKSFIYPIHPKPDLAHKLAIEAIKENIGNNNKIEPKFKVGDWIACKELNTALILNIDDDRYEVEFIDGTKGFPHIDYIDRLFHLWTIKDAKDGDVLQLGKVTAIFKEYSGDETCICYCSVCKGEFEIPADDGFNNVYGCYDTHPATKEQRDTLMKAMADAGWEFDLEKNELKKINKNTDVGHEYFSDLLEKDDCDNIDDYAYQCAYCMSHDWMKEMATWEDIQKAVKLGAKWQKQKPAEWSDEDMKEALRTEYEKGKADAIAEMQEEWKDEDDDLFISIEDSLSDYLDYTIKDSKLTKHDKDIAELRVLGYIDWLKSLKDRMGGKV